MFQDDLIQPLCAVINSIVYCTFELKYLNIMVSLDVSSLKNKVFTSHLHIQIRYNGRGSYEKHVFSLFNQLRAMSVKSMAESKAAVTPMRWKWGYWSLGQSHRNGFVPQSVKHLQA